MRILIVLLCDFLIVLTCDLLIFNLFLYHIKKIDYKLQWVCTEIRHDDVKMWAEHQRHYRLRLVFSHHILMSSVIFLLNGHTAGFVFL